MSIINKINNGEFELYLHPRQKEDYISGADLYQYLKDKNLLDGCATLKDLKAIQKEGLEFFREHFGDNFVYAWKSVRNRHGNLSVPYLYKSGGRVVLCWRWLDNDWYGGNPALRLASRPKLSTPESSKPLDFSTPCPHCGKLVKITLNK